MVSSNVSLIDPLSATQSLFLIVGTEPTNLTLRYILSPLFKTEIYWYILDSHSDHIHHKKIVPGHDIFWFFFPQSPSSF